MKKKHSERRNTKEKAFTLVRKSGIGCSLGFDLCYPVGCLPIPSPSLLCKGGDQCILKGHYNSSDKDKKKKK